MSKLTYKASYYALYAMFAIILIVMGIFFFGGDATGDAVIPGVDPVLSKIEALTSEMEDSSISLLDMVIKYDLKYKK